MEWKSTTSSFKMLVITLAALGCLIYSESSEVVSRSWLDKLLFSFRLLPLLCLEEVSHQLSRPVSSSSMKYKMKCNIMSVSPQKEITMLSLKGFSNFWVTSFSSRHIFWYDLYTFYSLLQLPLKFSLHYFSFIPCFCLLFCTSDISYHNTPAL